MNRSTASAANFGDRFQTRNYAYVSFGSLDQDLANVVESAMNLPPAEFTPLLLHLSRADPRERFGQGL